MALCESKSVLLCTLIVVACIMLPCVIAQDNPVITEQVQFSSDAPSGTLIMHGTLYRPLHVQPNSHRAVILIPGSGNNNRNESVENYILVNTQAEPKKQPNCGVTALNFNPFYEIAIELVRKGMVVLTYDKRGCCTKHAECSLCTLINHGTYHTFNDSCYYGCSAHAPQKYNMNLLSQRDFAHDALNGLHYLTTRPEVKLSELAILGHSEGVNVAVKAMNMFNIDENVLNGKRVSNVFLMNGLCYDYGQLLVEQYFRIANNWEALKNACQVQDPSSPLINAANFNIQNGREIGQALANFFPRFKEGKFPLDRAYNVGFWTSGHFLESGLEYASYQTMRNELLTSKYLPFVCSLNSPTDQNIPSENYKNIIKILTERIHSLPQVLENLTHFDTPSDLSSGRIEKRVLDLISYCLLKK